MQLANRALWHHLLSLSWPCHCLRMRWLCFTYGFLAAVAPLAGQGQGSKLPPGHGTVVVRPLSLGTDSTQLLRSVADTTRAHIVVELKAAGVQIVDRSQRPVRASDLTDLVVAHFVIIGAVGLVDSQFVIIARLASSDGDSLNQVRLLGSPASAAAFGDSLARLFAPTILGRPNTRP